MIQLDTILALSQFSPPELQLEFIRRQKDGEAIVAYLREKQHLWHSVLLDEIEYFPSANAHRLDLPGLATLQRLAINANVWEASQLYFYTPSESAAYELLEGGDALKLWSSFAAIIFDQMSSHEMLGYFSPDETFRVMIIRLNR
jgi:hypothetical protein